MSSYSIALLTAANAGDAGAIKELLATAQPNIRRYARRACKTTSDVEDAVQEVMIALYRHVSAAREIRAVAGWLFTVTIRHCLRLAQWFVRSVNDAEADAALEKLARRPEHELRIDLADAIQSLPSHYREVVLLRDIEEYTIDEIASALATTREAVKARLRRARVLLRDFLTDPQG